MKEIQDTEMLSSHHATNLQRSGLATLKFLELPCNQQKERDPGYRAVVQTSGNKPAIHTLNSPPCKRTPQIQPTCCTLSLMQRTKSLHHPTAALTQPWKKKNYISGSHSPEEAHHRHHHHLTGSSLLCYNQRLICGHCRKQQ